MSNKKQSSRFINTLYYSSNQRFISKDAEGNVIKDSSFKIPHRSQRLIFNQNATICILDDGSKGVSKCMPEDKYDEVKGIKIAYLRAKIKSINKELKQLCK